MVAIDKAIRTIRKNLELTQEQFAFRLGVKRSLIGAYEEGRAEPNLERLAQIAEMGDISLDDLLGLAGRNVANRKANFEKEGNIQFVPIKAAAGYLSGFGDEEMISELPRFSLPMLGKGKYRAFEISGDSMLPLESGSIVVGEHTESLLHLKASKAYILVTKRDGIVYKRVLENITDTGEISLGSDNPKYKPYSINVEDVLEAWSARVFVWEVGGLEK